MTHQDFPALRQQFLSAMSCAANTVHIVTTGGAAGQAGLTLSAMASVSADAEHPTLLVCVNEQTLTAERIRANGVFCVNMLRHDQIDIANCFAGRTSLQGDEKFACAGWHTMPLGTPALDGALVSFDCKLALAHKIGTHYLFLGAVHHVTAQDGDPLVYMRRGYATTTCLA